MVHFSLKWPLLLAALRMVTGLRVPGNMVAHDTAASLLNQPLTRDHLLRFAGTAAAILTSAAGASAADNGASSVASVADGYDLSLERIYDTRAGSYLPAQPGHLFRNGHLPDSPIICLGEHHTSPLDHRNQFRTIAALREASAGVPLAIGLEMFYTIHQPALDRFVYEHGDLGVLARDTNWKKNWGYDFNLGYSKIFRYARVHGLRLVGLNVPRAVTALVRKDGLSGLPRDLRQALPEVDLDVKPHWERFQASMEAMAAFHGVTSGSWDQSVLRRYYEALTLWEEAMAQGAAAHVKRHGGRMAVMAGAAHLAHRDSMPDRIQRRTGMAPFTIVPEAVDWESDTRLPLVPSPPGADTADWWWYTQAELPRRGRTAPRA